MSDRGMKKWLPFSSLVEQKEYLEKMIYEKNKIKKPQVSIEQANKINRILKENTNVPLNFKIYIDGYIYSLTDTIEKIDLINHYVFFKDFYVPIMNIIDIENPSDFDEIC